MINLKYDLTVDDLIVEYMMYKVKNGYEPNFLTSEFIDFLHFFESKMQVQDSLYDGEKLFKRFFERKAEHDWSITKNYDTGEKDIIPHMDMEYSEKDNDYIIKANHKLSDFDKSIINTYFMDNGMGKYDDFKGTVSKIRSIIGEYLSNKPKRSFDESIKIDEKDLRIGKYLSAEIITQIWLSHIDKQIKSGKWPKQCRDINKYLFEYDLADIIGVSSIKNELIELYKVMSKRIAILYHQDKNLKVSSLARSYLEEANYKLLIQGYEKLIGTAFGPYKKSMGFDLEFLTFRELHEIDGVYFEDDEPDYKLTKNTIGNDKAKELVKNIEKLEQKETVKNH